MDNCIGSGTTAIGCLKTDRRFIGIELSEKYCEIAKKRIQECKKQILLQPLVVKTERRHGFPPNPKGIGYPA